MEFNSSTNPPPNIKDSGVRTHSCCHICKHFSAKAGFSEHLHDDEGKCFVDYPTLYWVKGWWVCPKFEPEAIENGS